MGVLCLAVTEGRGQNRMTKLERRVEVLERQVEVLKAMLIQVSPPGKVVDTTRIHQTHTVANRNWDSLKIGMTEEEVQKLMGEPVRIQRLLSLTTWFYEGGAAYIRPHVTFDNDSHLVYGWVAP